MTILTDEEIAKRVQEKDTNSFGILVERYEKRIVRYGRKFLSGNEDIQDIVQDIFVKAYTNIQSFDTERKFSSWLYRIAHNEFVNALKKRKKYSLSFFDPDTVFPPLFSKESTDGEIHIQEMQDMLSVSLDKLGPKYREPLILYYLEDMDYKEIAEVLHIPSSTVGIRLKRGKQALKRIYDTFNKDHD